MADLSGDSAAPRLRTDLVDAYLFRVKDETAALERTEFLQLRRSTSAPVMPDTWQTIMGHIDSTCDRSAIDAVVREIEEETGLDVIHSAIGFWQVEQVHPFFVAPSNEIVLTPRFAVQVPTDWTPRLNREHSEYRWIRADEVERFFVWPGQALTVREVLRSIVDPHSAGRDHLRIARDAIRSR